MPYQQTPQGLDTLANLPTAFQPQGLALLSQQQNADQMSQQDQSRQLAYDTANDPLKLRQNDLANQTTAAELPWHQAKASMLQRADSNEAQTNDVRIRDIVGKYNSADMQRHVQDVENLGQVAQHQYQSIYMNPFGGAQRAQKAFEDAGHGDMWNPEWNDLPAGELAAKLKDYGSGIQETSAKFRQAMNVQELKNKGLEGTNETKERIAKINAQQRADTAASLMATKKAIANIPKSLNDYASKMAQLADEETDPDLKQKYQAEAMSAANRANALASAGANATTAPKVNLNTLLGPGSTWGDPPNPTPPMAGAQGTVPTNLPQGTTDNGDGTFTLPDGRRVRAKAK